MVGGCIIGLGVTLCSLPRMHQAGVPLLLYLFSSWILMSIVGAAVCAWGAIDGMRRLCPSRESRPAVLLSVAVLAGLLGAAITAIWIDPLLNEVLRHSEQPLAFQLRFPDSWQGRLALVLWAASFQALFLYAGPMAFFTRLFGRRQAGIVACVLLRLIVTARQMDHVGVAGLLPVLALTGGLHAAFGGWIYSRGGLLTVALFLAVLQLHLWF